MRPSRGLLIVSAKVSADIWRLPFAVDPVAVTQLLRLHAPLVDFAHLRRSCSPPSLIVSRSDSALETYQPELYQMIQRHEGD